MKGDIENKIFFRKLWIFEFFILKVIKFREFSKEKAEKIDYLFLLKFSDFLIFLQLYVPTAKKGIEDVLAINLWKM